jgi:serine/threonine protein kinase
MKIQAPPPGTVLAGKYLVEGLLGVGGMGVVLTARHQQLDQKVAIKVLLPEVARHPEIVERFAREARAAAKIQGEHVARVVDVGVLDDGSPFMVMEHLEGRDLAAELRARGPLPAADVAHWIVEACEAIAQAHAAKIVHRDLKPSNLFLALQPDNRSVVKVLDFGISKIVDPDAPALTKTSSLVGTPYYMSPEQLTAAKTLDTRADIWAIGVIMYELLTGKPPFVGESMPEVVAAILKNEPISLDVVRPGLPPGFADVVASCIQTNPGQRYQSVAALSAALAPFGMQRDQLSAERIARVLGITTLEEPIPPTEPAPVATNAPIEKTLLLSEAPPSPVPASPRVDPVIADVKTQVGVATSISDAPVTEAHRERRMQPLIAIVLAVALGIGAWAAFARHNSNGGVRTDNNGGTSTAASMATSSSVTMPSASLSVATPPTTPPSAASASAPVVASAPLVVPAVTRILPRPSVAIPPASSSSPTPTPTASPSKSPLDMGLK